MREIECHIHDTDDSGREEGHSVASQSKRVEDGRCIVQNGVDLQMIDVSRLSQSQFCGPLTPVHCWKNMVKVPTAVRNKRAECVFRELSSTPRSGVRRTARREQTHVGVQAKLEVRHEGSVLVLREVHLRGLHLEEMLRLDFPETLGK